MSIIWIANHYLGAIVGNAILMCQAYALWTVYICVVDYDVSSICTMDCLFVLCITMCGTEVRTHFICGSPLVSEVTLTGVMVGDVIL